MNNIRLTDCKIGFKYRVINMNFESKDLHILNSLGICIGSIVFIKNVSLFRNIMNIGIDRIGNLSFVMLRYVDAKRIYVEQ
jgi:hypothetical protein